MKLTKGIVPKIHGLLNDKSLMKYSFNTGWLMLEKILRLSLGLWVGVWVARHLGPEEFGVLNYSISIVALFGAISTLGLSDIVVKKLLYSPEDRDDILGTSIILQGTGAIVLLITVFCTLWLFSIPKKEFIVIMIIAFSQIFLSLSVIDYYFQSQVKAKYIGLSNIWSLLISSCIRIILIILNFELVSFAIVIVAEQAVKMISLFLYYRYNQLNFRLWKFSFQRAKMLLSESWPLILSGMVIMLYMRVDQIMLKEMVGYNSVGQYSAASRISQAWYFIPNVICISIFPAIVKLKLKDENLVLSKFNDLFRFLVIVSLSVAIPVTFLSDQIIYVMFGKDYSEAANILVLHIWGGVFASVGIAQSRYWIAKNLQKYQLIITVISSLINIILNFIFIPIMEGEGAALALLITLCIGTVILPLFFNKTREISYITVKSLFLIKWKIKK
jgi:O-antigen/teichoic acid export membrane protein